jgi:hypothetical protein
LRILPGIAGRSHDRAALSRMNLRQLDELAIEWPEDLRHIGRP